MTAMNLPAITTASIEHYFQAVNAIPMLSVEREQILARNLKRDGDINAARDLVLSHLRLVVSVARGYNGYGLQQADLVQEGNIGLMKAVKRFDPEKGVRLASFAIHWIKAEIHEYILKNWRLVKVATTKAQRKLFFNLRSMTTNLGSLSQKDVNAVARELKVKPEEVIEMEARLTGQDVSLEPTADDNEDRVTPIAYLADGRVGPDEHYAIVETESRESTGLKAALAGLDERSRKIIEARWLAEGEEKTLHELAAEYGVSAERIRQIEAKAMQKMKAAMADLR
jgi:RNA polymerase sigma-32 factor